MSKRTFRNITVEDKLFAYTIGKKGDAIELKIWENKQIIHRKELNYVDEVTPSLVKTIIEKDIISK